MPNILKYRLSPGPQAARPFPQGEAKSAPFAIGEPSVQRPLSRGERDRVRGNAPNILNYRPSPGPQAARPLPQGEATPFAILAPAANIVKAMQRIIASNRYENAA